MTCVPTSLCANLRGNQSCKHRLARPFNVILDRRVLLEGIFSARMMAAEEEAVVLDTTVRHADASDVDLNDRHAGDKAECAAAPVLKLVKLPLSRVKALMKYDPELSLASQESVFLISKATEFLIETIAKDAYVYAQRSKRKTLQRRDIDNAVDAFDEFAFLEGTLD